MWQGLTNILYGLDDKDWTIIGQEDKLWQQGGRAGNVKSPGTDYAAPNAILVCSPLGNGRQITLFTFLRWCQQYESLLTGGLSELFYLEDGSDDVTDSRNSYEWDWCFLTCPLGVYWDGWVNFNWRAFHSPLHKIKVCKGKNLQKYCAASYLVSPWWKW